MRALGFLSRWNRAQAGRQPVHIALHAGELVPEVLPAGEAGLVHLRSHIRRAVQLAGAERIGHAVDVLSEEDADGSEAESDAGPAVSAETGSPSLLRQMAQSGVAVEVCLTSNQAILGTESEAHPLAAYLAAGVPVALATDDEGILRTDLSAEYLRAAAVQRLDYRQLKTIARTGLEKSFLAGASLWESPRSFTPVAACSSADPAAPSPPSPACQAFLAGSQRAMQQWKFERKLAAFETTQASLLAVP
jgi:adenosine deaminase